MGNLYYDKYKIERVKEKLYKRICYLCCKEFEMGLHERFCKHCKIRAKNLEVTKHDINFGR